MKLAENLKRLMKEKRIKSFRQLSLASGIAASNLHHYAQGRVPTDWIAMARLARCLDVSLYYLMFGEDDPIQNQVSENLYKEILSGDFHVEMKVKKRI